LFACGALLARQDNSWVVATSTRPLHGHQRDANAQQAKVSARNLAPTH